MDYRYDIGDTFMDDAVKDLKWEIVRIDYEDDEYPYECWPVDIIKQAKKIAEDEGDDYDDVLDYDFIDERQCFSEYDIKDYEYKQLQKENKRLKAENKKLKGEK